MTKHSFAALASLAAGALLAATVAAAGQETTPKSGTTQDQGSHQDQGAKPDQGSKADQGSKGTTGSAQKNQGRIDKPMRIDQQVSVPTDNGCTYTANLRGNVTPAKGGGGTTATGPEQKVDADLTIAAVLHCPNATDMKVSDQRITRTGMTRADLVNEMQLRGAMLSAAATSGPPCVYMPDLDLGTDGKVQVNGVTYLCPTSSGGAAPKQQP